MEDGPAENTIEQKVFHLINTMFRKLRQWKADILSAQQQTQTKDIPARRTFNRLLAGAKRKKKERLVGAAKQRKSSRKKKKEKAFGLNVGDVVVMRGDPKHSSEAIDGNRIVALYFYNLKDGREEVPPQIQHFGELITESDANQFALDIIKHFNMALSAEQFGAKKWNGITNYTRARDKRKKINDKLKQVTKNLGTQITKALKNKGVPMEDFNLVENFVNYYQPGKSSRSGIGQHQDATDMSIVVQLLNTGKFHATVKE